MTTIANAPSGENSNPAGTEKIPLSGDRFIQILNLIIRKLRETDGPTTLNMGAVLDGKYLRRSGTSVIGDNPLRETGGPTDLAMGAVADGQILKRSGANVVGANLIDTIYPVGSIYISVVSTNPGTLFGVGTWVAFGAGRVLVGIDAGQTEFDTVRETGGSKTHTLTSGEMPSHTHTQNAHTHIQDAHSHESNVRNTPTAFGTGALARSNNTGSVDQASTLNTTATNQNTTATNQNTGGGGAHNNLQPYIVVYMWERTG